MQVAAKIVGVHFGCTALIACMNERGILVIARQAREFRGKVRDMDEDFGKSVQ